MKGVILAGGLGTRLHPNTKVTNKHLLPVYDRPMIYYPLQTLADAGATEILIVCGPEHSGAFLNLLRSGKNFNVAISYEVQDEPLGIADGIRMAEDFTDGEKFIAILGDNIFEESVKESAQTFMKSDEGSHVFVKEVDDPERFGVIDIEDGKVIRIIEKPSNPQSKLAVTGLYMFDATIFDIIRNLKPSARGQYEITDVNNEYIKQGKLGYTVLNGMWTDAGTHDSLLHAANLVKEMQKS